MVCLDEKALFEKAIGGFSKFALLIGQVLNLKPVNILAMMLAILFTWNQLIGQLHFAKLSWTVKSLGVI